MRLQGLDLLQSQVTVDNSNILPISGKLEEKDTERMGLERKKVNMREKCSRLSPLPREPVER